MKGVILTYQNVFLKEAATITEHIKSFDIFSVHKIELWNTFISKPTAKVLLNYDFVVFHYSIFGNDKYKFNRHTLAALRDSSVVKIAFFQDEYLNMPKRIDFINDSGIDIVYTLLSEKYFNLYTDQTSVKCVIQTLTGYIDKNNYSEFITGRKPLADRTIDVSYRARRLPFYMGIGAQEKGYIADEFTNQVRYKNFTLDISCDEKDRLYGREWTELLCNSRFTLSVEAGVSVFDTTGAVKTKIDKYMSENPSATFDQIFELFLKDIDGKIDYRTISPRFFEAAAAGVVPIMFPGNYNGLLKANINYICLAKDFSNIEEVIETMADTAAYQKIVDTNDELLRHNHDITYRKFILDFDDALDAYVEENGIQVVERKLKKFSFHAFKVVSYLRVPWLYIRFGKWPFRRYAVAGIKYFVHKTRQFV
ncbi:hypothetical protein N9C64_00615 [Paracoccaceae bacterium]|nr:hypothetical protein [Paracoccaceae bacterium]